MDLNNNLENRPNRSATLKNLRNNAKVKAGALLAIAAIGGPVGVVVANNTVKSPGKIENPKPLPKLEQQSLINSYHSMSAEQQRQVWEAQQATKEAADRVVAATVNDFVSNVLGRSVEGLSEGSPRIDINADNNRDGVVVSHAAWQTEGLSDGSLRDNVDMRIVAEDGSALNNNTLGVSIGGLFVNDDSDRYDINQSEITRIVVMDHEAEVYGREIDLTFQARSDGNWDFAAFDHNDPSVTGLFDSVAADSSVSNTGAPQWSPNEYLQRAVDIRTMLTSIETSYGLR